jgi:hypothetical protein
MTDSPDFVRLQPEPIIARPRGEHVDAQTLVTEGYRTEADASKGDPVEGTDIIEVQHDSMVHACGAIALESAPQADAPIYAEEGVDVSDDSPAEPSPEEANNTRVPSESEPTSDETAIHNIDVAKDSDTDDHSQDSAVRNPERTDDALVAGVEVQIHEDDSDPEHTESDPKNPRARVDKFMDECKTAIQDSGMYPLHCRDVALSIASLLKEDAGEPYILELYDGDYDEAVSDKPPQVEPKALSGTFDERGPFAWHWVCGSGDTVYDPIVGGPMDKQEYLQEAFVVPPRVNKVIEGQDLDSTLQPFYWRNNADTRRETYPRRQESYQPDASIGTLAYIGRPPAYLYAESMQLATRTILQEDLPHVAAMVEGRNAEQLKFYFRTGPERIARVATHSKDDTKMASANDHQVKERIFDEDVIAWVKPPRSDQLEAELIDTAVDRYCSGQMDAARFGRGMYVTQVLLQKFFDGNGAAGRAMQLLVEKAANQAGEITEEETKRLLRVGMEPAMLKGTLRFGRLHLQPDLANIVHVVSDFAVQQKGIEPSEVDRELALKFATPREVLTTLARREGMSVEALIPEFIRYMALDADLTGLNL